MQTQGEEGLHSENVTAKQGLVLRQSLGTGKVNLGQNDPAF